MIRIEFVGDVFLNPKHNCGSFSISEEVKRKWDACDKVCINMEGPILLNESTEKADKKGPCIYQDKVRVRTLTEITNAIFDLANNHIMDYGIRGLTDTINFIGKEKCFGAGENCYQEQIVTDKDGKEKVVILAVAENGFGCECNEGGRGYAWFDSAELWNRIDELKSQNLPLIVLAHAGLEDENIPLPEIRQLYRRYIDHGADVVIAHHPHMIQGKEIYKGKDIYYSLGNAVFEQLGTGEPYNADSISIEAEIIDGRVNTTVNPLRFENGVLKEAIQALDIFDKACAILKDEKIYNDAVNDMCIRHYRNEYTMYYKAVFGRSSRIKNLVFSVLYAFGRELFDEDMLFHNIVIETHYWTVKRALKYMRVKRSKK